MKDPGLEVVLPEAATLSELLPDLLLPGKLPSLWPTPPEITVKDAVDYFAGGKVIEIQKEGYEEPLVIPKAERPVIEGAISEAVKAGKLWLVSAPATLLAEPIPTGILTDAAQLLPPPSPIAATDVLPEKLPEAWQGQETTALAVAIALSKKIGDNLPWITVREAIDGATRARMLALTHDSGPWPCDISSAQTIKVRVPKEEAKPPSPPSPLPKPGVRVGEAELRTNEVQNLAEMLGDLVRAAAGYGLKFYVRIELGRDTLPPDEAVEEINKMLRQVSEHIKLK